MGLHWRGSHVYSGLVDVSGATKVGFGDYALAGGRTFYVDMSSGSDGRRGLNPRDPLETITAAMDLCTAGRGDAIAVMAASPSSPAANETFPVAMDVAGVLLTGLYSRGLLSDSGFGTDVLDGNTITASANYCNIENLYLGVKTGGTAGNVIEGGGSTYAFTLRNCLIETQYTALYGFYTGAAYDFPYLLIENNRFGRAGVSCFTNAIRIFNATSGAIRNNYFTGCTGSCIKILATCGETMVTDNHFQCYSDTDGDAIMCDSGSSGNYFAGNMAAFGDDDCSNDLFADYNNDDSNDWGWNTEGDDVSYPGTS